MTTHRSACVIAAWFGLAIAASGAGCAAGDLETEGIEQLDHGQDTQAVGGVEPGWAFIRGDANRDGRVDISDAIAILHWLHLGDAIITCQDAADVNDDGRVDQSDAQHLLTYLFLGGVELAGPHPAPGTDPTPDDIRCGVVDIDPDRSLAVRDVSFFSDDTFSLERVMTQLAAQSGEQGLTATALFQRWWSHQTGEDCVSPNEHDYDCDRAEGFLATMDPFGDSPDVTFKPVGLYNRFDLAPIDGEVTHCGEHRIVYAKDSGIGGTLLYIFEAQIPNPHPEDGLEGCRSLIEWWASLSDDGRSESERRDMLETLYFDGVSGYKPAIDIGNFAADTGQVRTNNFVQGPWLFREFKLAHECAAGSCTLDIVPEPVKTNPFVGYFDATSDLELLPEFQEYFIGQVQNLIGDPFFMDNDDRFNAAESAARFSDDYVAAFDSGTKEDPSFSDAIQAKLVELKSSLEPADVVQRANDLSCQGCHTNGTSFRHQFGQLEPGGQQFRISSPLRDILLPAREGGAESYLDE